jgi:hypothetical protein
MTDEENEALKQYRLLKDPQIELHCRATELLWEISERLDRAEQGSTPELAQRHKEARQELDDYLSLDRGEHESAILALELGPDGARERGLDTFYPTSPLDPDYEKLMTNLAARQYGEAEAFKKKLDDALEAGQPDAAAQFREDYQRLRQGFYDEETRYKQDYWRANQLADEWKALEQSIQNLDPKMTR